MSPRTQVGRRLLPPIFLPNIGHNQSASWIIALTFLTKNVSSESAFFVQRAHPYRVFLRTHIRINFRVSSSFTVPRVPAIPITLTVPTSPRVPSSLTVPRVPAIPITLIVPTSLRVSWSLTAPRVPAIPITLTVPTSLRVPSSLTVPRVSYGSHSIQKSDSFYSSHGPRAPIALILSPKNNLSLRYLYLKQRRYYLVWLYKVLEIYFFITLWLPVLYHNNYPYYPNRNTGIELFVVSIILIVTGIYDSRWRVL